MIYINAAMLYLALCAEACIRLGQIAEAVGDGDE